MGKATGMGRHATKCVRATQVGTNIRPKYYAAILS
jgi:hypothetical protein